MLSGFPLNQQSQILMPIEIRELVIKATVHKPIANGQEKGISRQELARIKKEILEKCREEMEELLEQKSHR